MNFGTLGTGFGGLGRGGAGGGGVSYEAESLTLFAAMSSQPDDTRKGVINTLIAALKTAGIWTELDLLYLTAAHDAQAARLNWKNPGTFDLVAVNSPTFEVDRGYTGDGATSRLRTQFTPSTNGVNYTQDDASLWVWVRGDTTGTRAIGNASSSPQASIVPRSTTNISIIINDATNANVALGVATAEGFSGVSRPNGSIKRAWKNGVQQGSDQAVASTGLPTQEQWMCGANNSHFYLLQESAGAWGSALTGLELSFYNAMAAYMTGVGAA